MLVTGADGFVGRRLVDTLMASGHDVTAAVSAGAEVQRGARAVSLELRDGHSVQRAVSSCDHLDAVAHLAAVASSVEALADPIRTWEVNALGTARLLSELVRLRGEGRGDPLVLLVSSAEVYDRAARPLRETDPVRPRSPYAASKLAAEMAATETAYRTGLRVVIARPFPHTGPGQDQRFVAAAFARRLAEAKRNGHRHVIVGNLSAVRDILDVRDVVRAYVALFEQGASGEIYNVASGHGISMEEMFRRLAAIVGADAVPEPDPVLLRPVDVPYLVGDPAKLHAATGWTPRITLDTTLADLVHAQAN